MRAELILNKKKENNVYIYEFIYIYSLNIFLDT